MAGVKPRERSRFFEHFYDNSIIQMMLELLPLYPSYTMIAAAPGGTPPRRISDYKFKKNFLPTVPRRGSDVAVLFIEDDFHDSGVNRIDSYLFLQSQSIHLFIF